MMDAWMYVIKNLSRLDEKPSRLKDAIFERFFRVAEIANFTRDQRVAYEASLKIMRDYNNTIRSAEEKGITKGMEKGRAEGRAEGFAEGEKKGKLEVARMLLSRGMSAEEVAALTNLPISMLH